VLLALVVIAYILFYWMPQPKDESTWITPITKPITGALWTPFNWQAGPDSTFEYDTIFKAKIVNPSNDFGALGLEQGERVHGKGTAEPLLLQVTVNETGNQALILNLTIKKGPAKTYGILSTINIGVAIFGDIGLDYDSPDLTAPHMGVIDFYYHTSPFWNGESWSPPGTAKYDSDYRAGKTMATMPAESTEYRFQNRIDPFIEKFLAHYGLPYFTIELVQAYIETRNAEGEIEISQVELGFAEL
jgi:hypothetical protein